MDQIENYADGSYSTSDDGGRGDIYALAPRVFPVPQFLAEYFDLAKALRVVTSTCALQQGKCWVVRRGAMLPRGGQRCGRGECNWRGQNSPGMSGLAGDILVPIRGQPGLFRCPPGYDTHPPPPGSPFNRCVRRVSRYARATSPLHGLAGELEELRAGTLAAKLGGEPVALATPKGLAVVYDGAVLPLWQRIFQNGPAEHFTVQGPSQTYSAAVRAAMVLANRTRRERLVYGWGEGGKPVPMVYVQPGGLVRSARPARGLATQVDRMDDFELRQAIAASSGASIMPFNM